MGFRSRGRRKAKKTWELNSATNKNNILTCDVRQEALETKRLGNFVIRLYLGRLDFTSRYSYNVMVSVTLNIIRGSRVFVCEEKFYNVTVYVYRQRLDNVIACKNVIKDQSKSMIGEDAQTDVAGRDKNKN